VKLRRALAEGQLVSWDDVEYDAAAQAVQVRREMESAFQPRVDAQERSSAVTA
jgi:predicted homoserine dehydrogenase-like protein